MAEIPNALTDLLRRKTPDEVYETLRDAHCLSSNGIEQRTQVLALIAEADAKALPPRKYQSSSSSTFVAFAAVTDAAIFGVMGPRNHRPAAVRYSYSIK